jgi:hypothetical protein
MLIVLLKQVPELTAFAAISVPPDSGFSRRKGDESGKLLDFKGEFPGQQRQYLRTGKIIRNFTTGFILLHLD